MYVMRVSWPGTAIIGTCARLPADAYVRLPVWRARRGVALERCPRLRCTLARTSRDKDASVQLVFIVTRSAPAPLFD